jgi:hypothetical protein
MTADPHDFLAAPRVFVRVYRLPAKLTDGYCFGAGRPITFLNVDWFEALISEGRIGLIRFIQGKQYFRPTERFLILGDDPQFTFVIEPSVHPVEAAKEERKPS